MQPRKLVASHGYSRPRVGTQNAYPQGDGHAELTWVAGYIPR